MFSLGKHIVYPGGFTSFKNQELTNAPILNQCSINATHLFIKLCPNIIFSDCMFLKQCTDQFITKDSILPVIIVILFHYTSTVKSLDTRHSQLPTFCLLF